MLKFIALSISPNLNLTSVAGFVCLIVAAFAAFATDFIMKLFKADSDTSYSTKNLIKFASIFIAALGVILIVNS